MQIALRRLLGPGREVRRRRDGARVEAIGAAGMEGAAGRKRSEHGNRTLDGPKPVTPLGAWQ